MVFRGNHTQTLRQLEENYKIGQSKLADLAGLYQPHKMSSADKR